MICKDVKNYKSQTIQDKIANFDKLTGRQKLNALKKLNCKSRNEIIRMKEGI